MRGRRLLAAAILVSLTTLASAQSQFESSKLSPGVVVQGGALQSPKLSPGIVVQGGALQSPKLLPGIVVQNAAFQSAKLSVGIVVETVPYRGFVVHEPLTHW